MGFVVCGGDFVLVEFGTSNKYTNQGGLVEEAGGFWVIVVGVVVVFWIFLYFVLKSTRFQLAHFLYPMHYEVGCGMM